MLSGKKTYIAAVLAAVSALALYAQGIVSHGFDMGELLKFLNSEAIVGALAFLRNAIEKK